MKLMIIGLIFTLIGALILVLNTIFGGWHQKTYINSWKKRFYWMGWRPFFKISHPSGKVERKIKWTRKVIVNGFIPPKYMWELIGFLFILIGVILQIKNIT